jgi:uncharacterized protein (DUF362 family)
MSKKSDNKYNKFNLMREKQGLPTLSRRDFVKLMAMGSAGLSIPFASCTSNSTQPLTPAGQAGATTQVTPVLGMGGSVTTTSTMGSGGVQTMNTGSAGKGAAGKNSSSNAAGSTQGSAGKAGSTGAAGSGKTNTTTSYKCSTCSHVGITRNADINKSVQTAIQLAGGLSAIKQGDKVVIKPNITGYTTDYCTHPEVITGIIKAVSDYTEIKNITVAECTALGMNTRSNAQGSGILDAVTALGANFDAWDEGEYGTFTSNKWTHITSARSIPKSLNPLAYDHFINAPVLKNHTMMNAQYTANIKLFMGILPYAGVGGRSDMHTADLAERVAELHMVIPKKVMCIVDATKPGLVNGPTPSVYGEGAGLIIASTDMVACDSVAVAVLRCYAKMQNITANYTTTSVWKQPQMVHAASLGLGVIDPKKIEIVDKDVDNIAAIKAEWV